MLTMLVDTFASHFYEILLLITVVIIAIIISNTIIKLINSRNSVHLGELSIQHEKLAMLKQQTLLRELAEASVVLKDEEKGRIDAIREDIAILSRKNLAMTNEVEAKVMRLERGVDLARLRGQSLKIHDQEKKLFGVKEDC
ncbi:MAG: hypothetical protein KAQ96_07010 [Thermoplasmata archaeon]|nr:hypothetical protein [Thermoplasmata archaeon]